MSNYYLSKCCNAKVDSVQAKDSAPPGMNWYNCKCQKCGELCDIYPVIDNQ